MRNKLIEKGLENFRTKNGAGFNCAQSVAYAFEEIYTSKEDVESLNTSGGGNVEGGVCGSIYAAGKILEKHKFEELKKNFNEETGSIKCREILKNKKISCHECVQKCVEFIHDKQYINK